MKEDKFLKLLLRIALKYVVTNDLNTIEKCTLDSKHIIDAPPQTPT